MWQKKAEFTPSINLAGFSAESTTPCQTRIRTQQQTAQAPTENQAANT